MRLKKIVSIFYLILILPLLIGSNAKAQGSISGFVTNSDGTTPTNGVITFVGFLEGTDEEIKIETCVGAGYDNGNWYDLHTNYLTASLGDQFDYHFYNIINEEYFYLVGTIDNSGFQREDVTLATNTLPNKPDGLTGKAKSGPIVEIDWDAIPGLTYHIYRRHSSSNGSFFRIDDPSGSLANPGVESGPFVDNTVDGINDYDYLIIAEDETGEFSPRSEYFTQPSNTFLCGDVDNDGGLNILDVVYFLNFKYKGGPEPDYPESADMDNDGFFNILDVVAFLNFKYKAGPALVCPSPF